MAELPGGTVTLVFTDIEGSTRLLASLGSRYEAVLADHHKLLRATFSSHARWRSTPRETPCSMRSPGPRRRSGERWRRSGRWLPMSSEREWSSVRMGIHTGEPSLSDEGYVGTDVHLGARISALAWGGPVVVSSATAAWWVGMQTRSRCALWASTPSRISTTGWNCIRLWLRVFGRTEVARRKSRGLRAHNQVCRQFLAQSCLLTVARACALGGRRPSSRSRFRLAEGTRSLFIHGWRSDHDPVRRFLMKVIPAMVPTSTPKTPSSTPMATPMKPKRNPPTTLPTIQPTSPSMIHSVMLVVLHP
jgi:hypothetical protein